MDLTQLETDLAIAEERVALGQADIERQLETLVALEQAEGRGLDEAQCLLRSMEDTQGLHLDERNRLLRVVAAAKAEALAAPH